MACARSSARSSGPSSTSCHAPACPAPGAIPEDFRAHIRLMCDLLALAFQSDSTRIATLLFANEGNNRSFSEIGIAEGHHHLSHHQGKAENLEKVARIDRLLHGAVRPSSCGRLAAARDADGRSVLDNVHGAVRRRHRATATGTTTTTCPSCWRAGAGGRRRPAAT